MSRRTRLALGGLGAMAILLTGGWGLWVSARRGARWACKGLEPVRIPAVDVGSIRVRRIGPDGRATETARPLRIFLGRRPAVVNFWSAACAPCLEELPSLLDLARRSRRVPVALVNVDEKLEDAAFLWQRHPQFGPGSDGALWLWDPGGREARRLGTTKFPETYLVEPSGSSRWKVVSSRDWMGLAARRCLQSGRW